METYLSRLLSIGALAALLAFAGPPVKATDCDRNGVDDAEDIEAGTSLDCNRDLIPDECDLLPVNYGLEEVESIPIPWGGNSDIAFLDLEGDGDLDLALSDSLIHRVYLFWNLGGLHFEGVTGIPDSVEVGYRPQAMVSGDLDGDGATDLATVNLESSDVTALLSDGRGGFSASAYPVGRYPTSLAISDLDLDGDLDLAAASSNPPTGVQVLKNDGHGAFPAAENSTVDVKDYTMYPTLTAGDLDGDRYPEILVMPVDGNLTILWNSGAGVFPSKMATEMKGRYAAIADLDGDGMNDVVTDDVAVYLNPGDGGFTRPAFTHPPGWSGYPITADLDADGDLDFALGGAGITAFLNQGGGKFSFSPPFPGRGIVRAADLNGDGVVEMAASGDLKVLKPQAVAYSKDCNSNSVPDECDISSGTSKDCNGNRIPDECDLVQGLSQDCDGNGILDTCEKDCNGNGIHDDCDLVAGTAHDADADGILDECGVAFTLGFDAIDVVQGLPGETRTFDVYSTLATTNNFTPEGTQGWSLSLFSDGGAVEEISVKGIEVSTIYDDKAGNHHDPYEFDLGSSFTAIAGLSEHYEDSTRKGAVSAVVMSGLEHMVLQPRLTQRIARLRVKAKVPADGECGAMTLYYENGGKTSCSCPFSNSITYQGASKAPILGSVTISLCPSRFRRADTNSDGAVDISDPIFTLSYLFLGGRAPGCMEANDANDDALVDLSDPVFILGSLFLGGGLRRIPAPGAYTCGPDAAFQGLPCDASPCPPQLPGDR